MAGDESRFRLRDADAETSPELAEITLRETGLPAVTNVRGATRAFRTGDRLVLRADEGTVERVEPER